MSLLILVVLAHQPFQAWADSTAFELMNNVLEPGIMLLLGSCLLGL